MGHNVQSREIIFVKRCLVRVLERPLWNIGASKQMLSQRQGRKASFEPRTPPSKMYPDSQNTATPGVRGPRLEARQEALPPGGGARLAPVPFPDAIANFLSSIDIDV